MVPGVDIPNPAEQADDSLDLSKKTKNQKQSGKKARSNSYLSKKYKVSTSKLFIC